MTVKVEMVQPIVAMTTQRLAPTIRKERFNVVFGVIALGKALGGRLLISAGALLKDGLAKRSARNRAMKGEEPARQVLNSALALRIAAQLHGLRHPELRPFPSDADLDRLRNLSARLLEAGRATWKFPKFVAPLTLEAHEDKDDKEARPVTMAQLVEAIEDGDNLVLFGDGGIGKTTFLLELASAFALKAGRRAPLYVDAAIWARAGVSILDYLASTPPAQALGVTSVDLAKFAESGSLALLINGWNEIPAERKSFCRETFKILTTTAPALAAAVASRTAYDTASLQSPRRIIVRGLTWPGQSAMIRSELNEGSPLG